MNTAVAPPVGASCPGSTTAIPGSRAATIANLRELAETITP